MSLKRYSHFCRWCVFIGHEYIFAESPEELQTALDTMQLYCDTWKLQVNTSKTKIVVFSKGKIRQKPVFFIIMGSLLKLWMILVIWVLNLTIMANSVKLKSI